ncbi:Hypothetical predicted protein [Cloeon dipterum]|uniref:Uncharacterized protein n=1 Tax=Cloeon dipterum TaxID=197152 RepID=A0A8S1DG44_9INSE|nr:Hypothetical predicted protein [Cloeon dipterum]
MSRWSRGVAWAGGERPWRRAARTRRRQSRAARPGQAVAVQSVAAERVQGEQCVCPCEARACVSQGAAPAAASACRPLSGPRPPDSGRRGRRLSSSLSLPLSLFALSQPPQPPASQQQSPALQQAGVV